MAGFAESSDFYSLNEADEIPSQGVEEGPPNREMSLQDVIQEYEKTDQMDVDLSSFNEEEVLRDLFPEVHNMSVEGAFKPDGVSEIWTTDKGTTGEEEILSFHVSSADSNGGLQSPEERGTEIPHGTSTEVEKIIFNLSSSMDVINVIKLYSASEKYVEGQETTGDTTITEPMGEGESQKASTNVTSISVLSLNKPSCSKENNCSVFQAYGVVEQSNPKKMRANSKSARSRRTMQSRKRSDGRPHLYNMPPFKNPKKEKARLKAITTRNYRVQEKRQFDEVIDENDSLKKQLADKKHVIDNLNQQLVDVTDVNAELDNIKQQLAKVTEERDKLKQQLKHFKNQAKQL